MGSSNSRNVAYVNISLVAINVVYFLYLEAAGSSENTLFMVQHGAMYAPLVLEGHQYYRLLTAMFMHFGIRHIMNNMIILLILGDNLERALGRVKYFIFYMVCGIGANVASMAFYVESDQNVVSAGASGAIFGVIGGLLYAVIINRGRLEDLGIRQLAVLILCSLYFGFASAGVDNMAHIFGLAIGIILGAILYRRPKRKPGREIWEYES